MAPAILGAVHGNGMLLLLSKSNNPELAGFGLIN